VALCVPDGVPDAGASSLGKPPSLHGRARNGRPSGATPNANKVSETACRPRRSIDSTPRPSTQQPTCPAPRPCRTAPQGAGRAAAAGQQQADQVSTGGACAFPARDDGGGGGGGGGRRGRSTRRGGGGRIGAAFAAFLSRARVACSRGTVMRVRWCHGLRPTHARGARNGWLAPPHRRRLVAGGVGGSSHTAKSGGGLHALHPGPGDEDLCAVFRLRS
jgi:hypothetical protein